MNRYAKGEYGQKFNQLYDQYISDSDDNNSNNQELTGGYICGIYTGNYTGNYTGGSIDQQAINENTDFTKISPEQKKVLQDCFNKDPEEMMNIRNEEMLANNELFEGGNNDTTELQAYQSMRMKHHITVNDDNFISSYLNGGQCYTIDTTPDNDVIEQKRNTIQQYSRRKYTVGGFSDTNIQPILENNTLTNIYHQDAIQTTTGSEIPQQEVNNADTNQQQQQTALQEQNINEQANQQANEQVNEQKGGNKDTEESSSSVSSSSISSSTDDNGELLFGGEDNEKKNEKNNEKNNENSEGFLFM